MATSVVSLPLVVLFSFHGFGLRPPSRFRSKTWTLTFAFMLGATLFALHVAVLDALPPPGLRYPPVLALVVYYGGLFIYNWLGLSHLLDNLTPTPYTTLFTALLARVSVWLALPLVGIWWYQGALDELKREAIAAARLSGDLPASSSVTRQHDKKDKAGATL